MNITQVKVFPVGEEKLRAFVSVVFDHCFMVNDIKVIQGKDGLFLSMPSRRKRSGEFKDVAHPLNNEMRRQLEEKVLHEYRVVVEDGSPRRPDRSEEQEVALVAKPALVERSPVQVVQQAPVSNVVSAPAMAASAARSPNDSSVEKKTLEEVQEMHLRDSFWSVS